MSWRIWTQSDAIEGLYAMCVGRIIKAALCRTDPIIPRQTARRQWQIDLLQGSVQDGNDATLRPDIGHDAVSACLTTQPSTQVICALADQRSVSELEHLPEASTTIPDRCNIGTVQIRKPDSEAAIAHARYPPDPLRSL